MTALRLTILSWRSRWRLWSRGQCVVYNLTRAYGAHLRRLHRARGGAL